MVTKANIRGAVKGNIGFSNVLSPSLVVTVKFEPTIGIVAGRIEKLGLDIRSFREPLLRSVREVMVPSIRRNFDEGGRPDAWAPLSEYTLARRAQQGTGEQILVATGLLRRVASQINIWSISTTNAVIRDLPEKIWYGKVHQAGYGSNNAQELMRKLQKKHGPGMASARKVNVEFQQIMKAQGKLGKVSTGKRASPSIPARPFLIIQAEDEIAIEAIFIKWLDERVARNMARL